MQFRVSEVLSVLVVQGVSSDVVSVTVYEHRVDLARGPYEAEVIVGSIRSDGCVNWETVKPFHFCEVTEMTDLVECFKVALIFAERLFASTNTLTPLPFGRQLPKEWTESVSDNNAD